MAIDINTIASVYSGVDGACCCGCKGNHRYSSAFRTQAGKARGYEVTAEEVSDRSVKLICGKIDRIEKKEDGGSYIAASANGRIYIAYFVEG